MKKKQLEKMILMGMAGGWMAVSEGNAAETIQDGPSLDAKKMEQYMIAKPRCAPGGCASLTASRDVKDSSDEEEVEESLEEGSEAPKKKGDAQEGTVQSKKESFQKAQPKNNSVKLS